MPPFNLSMTITDISKPGPIALSKLDTRLIERVERKACRSPGCDFVHWGNPLPVAAAPIEYRGRIIFVRNTQWPHGVSLFCRGKRTVEKTSRNPLPTASLLMQRRNEVKRHVSMGPLQFFLLTFFLFFMSLPARAIETPYLSNITPKVMAKLHEPEGRFLRAPDTFFGHKSQFGRGNKVCAPDPMLKVVAKFDIPGVPMGHFLRAPKTIYRYGSRYGRIEETYNPITDAQILVIANEPDIWVVNLATQSGKYVRDPGPTYYFRARIFGDTAVKSPVLRSLEFGCEIPWLRESGATDKTTTDPTLGYVRRLEYFEENEKAILYERAGKPVRLELFRNGQLIFTMEYIEYAPDLKFEKALFEKPSGVVF